MAAAAAYKVIAGCEEDGSALALAAKVCEVGFEVEVKEGGELGTVLVRAGAGGEELARGRDAVLRYMAAASAGTKNGSPEGTGAGAEADKWLDFASHEIATAAGSGTIDKALDALEKHLESRTYLVSDRLSVADVAVAYSLKDVAAVDKMPPSTRRFFLTVTNQRTGPTMPLKEVTELDNKVIAKLTSLGMQHKTYAHAPAMTVDEQMREIGHLPGAKTKNLFLRDKKRGSLYLVTASFDAKTDTKTIATLLGLTGANLRFADSSILEEVLGVQQGAVGPLALVNDPDGKCTFVIDKSLANCDLVNSHPLRNDRTTAVSSSDLLAYARACGHAPVQLDFSAPPPASKAKGGGGKGEKSAAAPKGLQKPKHERAADSTKEVKKETLLGISKSKVDDFPGWYTQVITYAEMIEYSDISGCYILRPWGYACWEHVQRWLDDRIKELGVMNSYFPLFVSKKALEAEENHVEGFAPEVAWITRAGSTEMEEPIAVRPTSETIMYPAFAKWIRSHRDLPLLLNQWANVVRWEFKYPTPFIRSREFLWQEGHTAHETFEEAEEMVFNVLDIYARVYEELLAVPVIKGTKTEMEKFAGGFRTTTVEAYIAGSGRSVQGATSHNLGQNFGKMFNISFESREKDGGHQIPWQTSWGLTTRVIGVSVMCHGDDQGLVLPPRIAPVQVVVVPIVTKKCTYQDLKPVADEVVKELRGMGVRCQYDARDNYTSGWKYNHWEQKGVPVRLELGPRDMEQRQVVAVRRDEGTKTVIALADLSKQIPTLLDDIHNNIFEKAKKERDSHYSRVLKWADFVPALNKNHIVLTPFCNETEWEEKVKVMSREEALDGELEDERTSTSVAAKTLCIPLDQPDLPAGTECFVSGKPATCWVLWGRSY